MRLFVTLAALLLGASAVQASAQEVPYEPRLVGDSEGPLVHTPEYRAPEYDTDTHVLAYVVSALGMPEADLPFVYPPGGMLVHRSRLDEFRAYARTLGETALFLCTVQEGERPGFDFAEHRSRNAHCELER